MVIMALILLGRREPSGLTLTCLKIGFFVSSRKISEFALLKGMMPCSLLEFELLYGDGTCEFWELTNFNCDLGGVGDLT